MARYDDGKGTVYYASGAKYEGEFLNGDKHGKGTFYNEDGVRYFANDIDDMLAELAEILKKK
jgi:hypothetical protein